MLDLSVLFGIPNVNAQINLIQRELGAADAKSAQPFLPLWRRCVLEKSDGRPEAVMQNKLNRKANRELLRKQPSLARLARFRNLVRCPTAPAKHASASKKPTTAE